jgi:hypothetical protein
MNEMQEHRVAELPMSWWRKIKEARSTVSEPSFFEIGRRTTFDEVFEFDRAMEDARFRYYLRQAVAEEQAEFEKAGGLTAIVGGSLVMKVTVLGPGLRVRQPAYIAFEGAPMVQEPAKQAGQPKAKPTTKKVKGRSVGPDEPRCKGRAGEDERQLRLYIHGRVTAHCPTGAIATGCKISEASRTVSWT